LLVIPTGRALLYAEPIYLQAERSPMPELRLVVLALQDKLAYGSTFEAALSALFEGTASSLTAVATSAPPPAGSKTIPAVATTTPSGTDTKSTIAEAAQDFADYQRLTAEGKLSQAGEKLDQLKRAIDRLNASQK
jgi:uncharacterized membrane protein (UPF0182 family)